MHSYSTDVDRSRVTLLIGAGSVGVSFLIYWVLQSAGIAAPWWVALPGPIAIGAVVFTIYDRFAWRWSVWSVRFSAIPDLGGVWNGQITSDYDNGTTSQLGTLRITQRWTTIHIGYAATRQFFNFEFTGCSGSA